MDQDLKEQYKSQFGKYPRKDWSEERVRERLGLTVESTESTQEEVQEAPKVIKSEPKAVEAKAEELPLTKGRMFLVYFNGSIRYWTKATLDVMIRTHASSISLPEGSPYQPNATVKRCRNCG